MRQDAQKQNQNITGHFNTDENTLLLKKVYVNIGLIF